MPGKTRPDKNTHYPFVNNLLLQEVQEQTSEINTKLNAAAGMTMIYLIYRWYQNKN